MLTLVPTQRNDTYENPTNGRAPHGQNASALGANANVGWQRRRKTDMLAAARRVSLRVCE